MNAELEILGVKLKHYRVDAAMEIAEEYLSNDKLNTIGIVTMQMLMQASKEPTAAAAAAMQQAGRWIGGDPMNDSRNLSGPVLMPGATAAAMKCAKSAGWNGM